MIKGTFKYQMTLRRRGGSNRQCAVIWEEKDWPKCHVTFLVAKKA